MLPDWATAAADEKTRWDHTAERTQRAPRHESPALDGPLFCSWLDVLPHGPFPGYAQLVGDSADAITFFIGSILFTAGGGLQRWAGRWQRDPPRGRGARG